MSRGWKPEARAKARDVIRARMRDRALNYESHFWSTVEKRDADECWVWTGPAHDSAGYGQFCCAGKQTLAHRVAWELTYGSIPDGLFVLHRCDNPRCVRPDHLFLGTQRDNVRDCVSKGRFYGANGERSPTAKLTDDQARSIYQRAWSGEPQRDLACAYGVGLETISGIKRGKSYARATQHLRREQSHAPFDRCGGNNPNAKLTDEQARCIYQRARAGERHVDLAREYRVSHTTIAAISHGKRFVRVTARQ